MIARMSEVVPTDATEAEPFPLHAGLNALADRAPAGSPHNFPVSDGIYTGGYPGNSVLDGNLLYVAGTLSEAPPAGGCPSGQAAMPSKSMPAMARARNRHLRIKQRLRGGRKSGYP